MKLNMANNSAKPAAAIFASLALTVPAAGQNLVSHYMLDETSGTVVSDSSGNGLHGVTVPTTDWVPGYVDGGIAMRLDGHVVVPSSPLHDISPLTIAAWVSVDVFENWDGILTKGTSTAPYSLQIASPDGLFKFTANAHSPTGGVGGGAFVSNGRLTAGQWHHVAVTFDGNEVLLYMDGMLDSTHPTPGMILGTTTGDLILGCDFPGGDEFFEGIMDDVRLYDGPLTAQQINGLYGGSIGTKYCAANANSTGSAAQITATGSDSVAANILTLTSEPVPDQPGIFFYARNQVEVPFGNGYLCISGGIVRLPVVVGSGNSASYALDFGSLPASGQINPGDTWNFQHWTRDPAAGGAFFNTSDAVSILFTL